MIWPRAARRWAILLRACLHGGGGPQVGKIPCGGSPHLSCKRDHIKMSDYMNRRVQDLKIKKKSILFKNSQGIYMNKINNNTVKNLARSI